MDRDYEFTGIGSGPDDGGPDFDGLMGYEQHPLGQDPTSFAGLNPLSEADRAVQRECRGCASYQGGTNFDNELGQLASEAPGQTEAPDLTEDPYIEQIPGSCAWGEYERRQWKESDNTGGDGVTPLEYPAYVMPKPKAKPLK